jgi:ATP-dependent DNA ligase
MTTQVFLYAFDLLELDGEDYRSHPLEQRKAFLRGLMECGSRNTWTAMARPFSTKPAKWDWKVEAEGFRVSVRSVQKLAENQKSWIRSYESRMGVGDQTVVME